MHGEEESGGRGLRGGPGPVREPLVENRVPFEEDVAVAKERRTRAIAALGKVAVLSQRREGERVNASLEGPCQFMKFGAAFLIRDGALDEAKVVANAVVELPEGSDGTAVPSAAKGAVKMGKFGRIVRVVGGEVIVLPHLGVEHGEAFGKSVAGANADACIDIAGQTTPTGLGVGEKGRERLRRGGKTSIVCVELVCPGEGESRHNGIAGIALREVEGGLAENGAARGGRQRQGEEVIREVVVVIGGLKGYRASTGRSHFST